MALATSADEWEWEYDDEETEDIYFTLDLTTHVPDAVGEREVSANGKRLRITAAEKKAASERRLAKWVAREKAAANGGAPAPDADLDPLDQDEPAQTATHPREADAINDNGEKEPGRLQLLGLHTENPYVKYNNGFYSCHWHTDLGTQLWVSRPGIVEDPRMAGHVLDIIGSSQARLVAKPATLKRKQAPDDGPNAAAIDLDAEEEMLGDVYEPEDPDQPIRIKRSRINDPYSEGQADFMERLSALKIKRGESDAQKVPLKMPVYYKGARNAHELREQALAREDDELLIQGSGRPGPSGDRTREAASFGRTANLPHKQAQAQQDDSDPDYTPKRKAAAPSTRGEGTRRHGGGAVSRTFLRESLGLPTATGMDPPTVRTKRSYTKSGKYAKTGRAAQAEQASNDDPSQLIDLDSRSPGSPESTGSPESPHRHGEGEDGAEFSGSVHSASPGPSASPAPNATATQHQLRARVTRRPRRSRAEMEAEKAAKLAAGPQQPRKRRRTKEQMAAAREEEARVKAAKATAKAEKAAGQASEKAAPKNSEKEKPVRIPTAAGTFETDAAGNIVGTEAAAKRRQTREAREFGRAQEQRARQALEGPVQGGQEMVLRFDEPAGQRRAGTRGSGRAFALDPQLMENAADQGDEGEVDDPLADLERVGEDDADADEAA